METVETPLDPPLEGDFVDHFVANLRAGSVVFEFNYPCAHVHVPAIHVHVQCF